MCLSIFLIWYNSVTADPTYADADRLVQDIRSKYNGNIRPVANFLHPVRINMTLYLLDIQDFDEVLETLKTSAIVSLSWFDQGTVWNTTEYGGLDFITLRDYDFLWTPPISLMNTAERMKDLIGNERCVAILENEGEVHAAPADILHSSCQVDISNYPFDTQTCAFTFVPFGYMPHLLAFNTETSSVDLKYFTPTGSWRFVESTSFLNNYNATFVIVLQRKPLYVILNMFVPIIALSILNVFVFWIPVESGERISYCLTVLLSLAVFLTLVGQTLPKTSEPMSWFSFSLVETMLTSIGITITVIFNMRLYFRDDSSDVGRFWNKVMSCLPKGKSSEKNSSPENRYINTQDNQYVQHGNNENSINGLVSFGDNHVLSTGHCANVNIINSSYLNRGVDLQTSCKENTSVSNDDNIETDNAHNLSEVKVTWKEVTQFIDKIGFIFFLMILLCTYILFAVKSIYRI